MIELLEEQNRLLLSIIDSSRFAVNDMLSTEDNIKRHVRASHSQIKMESAIAYLRRNPEACTQSGRELEGNGLGISYRTWNEAKKRL